MEQPAQTHRHAQAAKQRPLELTSYLETRRQMVDEALDRFLPPEAERPPVIHQAMRYSVFAGGKRLRPILTLAAAEACGGEANDALPEACAVECLHTYSLVHDDLPCMDDDDLRRGKPTNHKVFGEGIAVLAGDALLTLAFEILAQSRESMAYMVRHRVRELAHAAGSRELIGGQTLDVEGEGKQLTPDEVTFIHQSKTASLLTAALRLGGMSAEASEPEMGALTEFGQKLGLAFQIIDDILDCTQSSEKLGKSAGKDQAALKNTYPSVFGMEESRRLAENLTREALGALDSFGEHAVPLREIAKYLLARDY